MEISTRSAVALTNTYAHAVKTIGNPDGVKNPSKIFQKDYPEPQGLGVDYQKDINIVKSSGPPLMCVNLKLLMLLENGFEIAARVDTLREQFRSEANEHHLKELDIIREGEEAGKTSKEIWEELRGLIDEKSELFKLGSGLCGSLLSDPDNYDALVRLTPGHVNMSV